ncbi:MAG: TlpA family protein disulfide reductase [Candidatus Hodarchaeales archaeon]|jgi:cytochrome oxidase Cu insertion factor (SCO1/SenC/PrrC family)
MEKDNSLNKLLKNIKPSTIAIFIIPIVLLASLLIFSGFDGLVASRDIEVTGIDGEKLSTADYRGKIQFIEFFATWCSSCKEITKAVVSYHDKYDFSDVIFWSISADPHQDQPNILQNYINDHNASEFVNEGTWKFARDLDEQRNSLNVTGVPHTFLMDQNGNFVNIGKNGETGRVTAISVEEIEVMIDNLREI